MTIGTVFRAAKKPVRIGSIHARHPPQLRLIARITLSGQLDALSPLDPRIADCEVVSRNVAATLSS